MRKSQEESLVVAGICFVLVGLLVVGMAIYSLIKELT
jgi:hypothetical protein